MKLETNTLVAYKVPLLVAVSVVVVCFMVWQAYLPLWRPHLQVDVATFQARATTFLDDASWSGMNVNEYQPGALWFFVLAGWIAAQPGNFDSYLTSVVLLNGVLILAHVWLFYAWGHKYSPWVFLLITIATGPILFYRFELITTLLVLLSWGAWQKKRYVGSAVFLGVATAVKVYPVVILPLLLMEVVKEKNWNKLIRVALAYVAGGLFVTGLFIWFGGNLEGIQSSLEFHELKPIGLEGIWGTVIPLAQQVGGIPLRMTPGYGVHGFTSDLPILTAGFLNWFWVVPYGVVLGLVLWFWRRRNYGSAGVWMVLLMAFVLLGKVVNPQYLWWFAVWLPLVPLKWFSKQEWILIVAATLLGLGLTQIIYPLNYSAFLDWFNGNSADSSLFWINAMRNVLWAVVVVLAVGGLWRNRQSKV